LARPAVIYPGALPWCYGIDDSRCLRGRCCFDAFHKTPSSHAVSNGRRVQRPFRVQLEGWARGAP